MLPRILSSTGLVFPAWTKSEPPSPGAVETVPSQIPSSFRSLSSSLASTSLASRVLAPADCLKYAKDRPTSVGKSFIIRAEYCKSSEPLLGHEFIVFRFQAAVAGLGASTCVVVERQATGVDLTASTITNLLQARLRTPTAPAVDSLSYHRGFGTGNADSTGKKVGWSVLSTLTFAPNTFPLECLYVLSNVVSTHAPLYHPITAQCFWYAGLIWRLVMDEFAGSYELDIDIRGGFHGDGDEFETCSAVGSTRDVPRAPVPGKEAEERGLWEIVSGKIEQEAEGLLDAYHYAWAKFQTRIERRKLSFSLPKLSAEKSRADEAELRAQLAESQLAVALARAKLLEEQLARSEERASSAITTLVDLEERAADMESLASDAEERAAKAFAIALSNEAKFNELLHEYSRLARKKNVSTTPLMATGETKAREDKDGRKRSLRR